MKTTYSYTILRYVHDLLSGEYANVGVVLYAPECNFIQAKCCQHYGRLSKMFISVEGEHIRALLRYIQRQVDEAGKRLKNEPLLTRPAGVMEIATQVLPADDSSLQWSPPGGGFSENPEETLNSLYARLIERYEEKLPQHGRDDKEIMKVYRAPMETRAILPRLQPKLIRAKDQNDEHEFKWAWKNRIWHVYEPISFDMMTAEHIVDKACRWLGHGMNLKDAEEDFDLTIMLGEPRLDKVKVAYAKAENILHKLPVPHEFVREHEADSFAQKLAAEMLAHPE